MTGFDWVDVEGLARRLRWNVLALAELVWDFILVKRRRCIEVSVVLQGQFLNFRWVFAEEDWRVMLDRHVLFQRGQVFKSNRRLAVSAPVHERAVNFDAALHSLLVLSDDCVEELEIFIAARVFLLAWLALLLFCWELGHRLFLIVKRDRWGDFALLWILNFSEWLAMRCSNLATFGLFLELNLDDSDKRITVLLVVVLFLFIGLLTEVLHSYLSLQPRHSLPKLLVKLCQSSILILEIGDSLLLVSKRSYILWTQQLRCLSRLCKLFS